MGICSSSSTDTESLGKSSRDLSVVLFGRISKENNIKKLDLSPRACSKLVERLRVNSRIQLSRIEHLLGSQNFHACFFSYHLSAENISGFTELVIASTRMPPHVQNKNNWFHLQTIGFVKILQTFHQIITNAICSSESCPILSAGPLFEYKWRDPDTGDIVSTCAHSYMHLLFEYAESSLKNGKNSEFTLEIAQDILRRTFRIYVHLYHEHYSQLCALRLSSEFDFRLVHLSHFLIRHKMMTVKELLPMRNFFNGKFRSLGCSLILK
jgi:MOB kinase activator 1